MMDSGLYEPFYLSSQPQSPSQLESAEVTDNNRKTEEKISSAMWGVFATGITIMANVVGTVPTMRTYQDRGCPSGIEYHHLNDTLIERKPVEQSHPPFVTELFSIGAILLGAKTIESSYQQYKREHDWKKLACGTCLSALNIAAACVPLIFGYWCDSGPGGIYTQTT